MKFPFYLQPDEMACGATCLSIIAKYYGRSLNLPNVIQLSVTTREGANIQGISEAAEKLGYRTLGTKLTWV